MKRPYIPLGCDQQGRLRPTFLDNPKAHTIAKRDSKSSAEYACAIESYDRADDMVRLFDLLLVIILVASIVAVVFRFI